MSSRYNNYKEDCFSFAEQADNMTDAIDSNVFEALASEHDASLAIELEDDFVAIEKPDIEPPERAKLKRELEREALIRLEEAARTIDEFTNVTSIWNRLDANRERKERYHEVGRSDVPLEWGASVEEIIIPAPISHPYWKQIMKGEFLEVIYDCPFEMHEVVEHIGISRSIFELKDDHKEILYYLAIRQYSCKKIASIRSQTDRNIRKIRDTLLKKIRKQLLLNLKSKKVLKHALTLEEKEFLLRNQGY